MAASGARVALVLLLGCSAAEPPALTAASGHLEVAGRRVPVAEVLARLDADGNGGISFDELRHEAWSYFVAEVEAGLASGGAAAKHGLEQLFSHFDGDASGNLDAQEVASVATLMQGRGGQSAKGPTAGGGAVGEERQRQMLRARARAPAAQAAARRLDQAKNLVDDTRCEAPKGFPSKPEGWVCINETAPIFCTNNKRAYDVEQCNAHGHCVSGQWLQGGCEYPICSQGPCFNDSHTISCGGVSAHGRLELKPRFNHLCHQGTRCHTFSDGLPPTRRRRTTNCHEECHHSDCHQVCHEDPSDPPVTTCVRHGCKLLSVADPSYVRKCVTGSTA